MYFLSRFHYQLNWSLVVSWDTGGVLWASDNDALAPKLCLNPESSSGEGFVRSNVAVQTSVIVWT